MMLFIIGLITDLIKDLTSDQDFTMKAILKPDLILGTIEDIDSIIEPVTAPIKTNSFAAWLDRLTQSQYEAWERVNRPEQH